ncbi:MAG: hypothetical protein BAJALOKI1v1_2110007 [Promethearchaeota archaeon]|nr:MAG: hypothetical protein BAJALOKI1v1_2110007 [Candidatus Lokiarchaeota archaeon]
MSKAISQAQERPLLFTQSSRPFDMDAKLTVNKSSSLLQR